MSIQLEKRAEQIGILLKKKNINQSPVMRVGFVCDISGSARSMYRDGTIQNTVDRLLAVSSKFDDNGEMDMWTFCSGFNRLDTASEADEGTYVQNKILDVSSVIKWGGTEYAPVMKDVVDFYFEPEVKKSGGFLGFGAKKETVNKSNVPALCLFITDGANSDASQTMKVLRESVDKPIYWLMVGVGAASNFKFIEKAADELPNVGFVNLASLSISDEQLYSEVICDELCEFVKRF